jgi:hypothetical protein
MQDMHYGIIAAQKTTLSAVSVCQSFGIRLIRYQIVYSIIESIFMDPIHERIRENPLETESTRIYKKKELFSIFFLPTTLKNKITDFSFFTGKKLQ